MVLEGDLESVILVIAEGSMGSSSFGNILQDFKLLLSSFNNFSVCHVKRLENCVAHSLARIAISNSFLVWVESVPPDICAIYSNDLCLLNE